VFTTQPVNASVQCGSNAVFSYTATGNSLVYAWEYRNLAVSPFWLNVTGAPIAGATVSGQATNTLTLTNVSAALNGYNFRGLISGPCTAVDFTNIVTLTITPYIVNVTPPSATICAGTLQKLSITNTVSGPSTASFTSGPLNFNVPDNIGTLSSFTIPVSGIPAGALITDVRIRLNMTHTYPADMVLNLKASHPTNILSLYKHNTNTDNGAASVPTAGFFNAVCSQVGTTQWRTVPTPFRYGITAPTGPFRADALNGVTNPGYTIMDPIGFVSNATTFASLFNAGDPNGTWTLGMCDGGPGDLGNFTGWSIEIDYVAPVFAQGVWTSAPAAPNTMWATAAGSGGAAYVAGTPATSIWVNPIANTNYTVVVTTATPCVSAPTTVPVTVITPLTGLVVPANKTVCVGTNTSFTVGFAGGPFTFQWEVSVNSGLTWAPVAGATSATLSLTAVTQLMNNNLYRVNINGGPCGSLTTAAARLNVNQLPVVSISSSTLQLVPGRIATLTGTSAPAPFSTTSWSWTRNGNAIAGVTGNSTTANIDQQGDYRATVTDVNGCVNSSNIVTIGSEASDYLWIYPNPNAGQFQVRLYYSGVQAERRKVIIYNAIGQFVAQKEFDLDTNTPRYLSMTFDLPLLAAGNYAVQVVDKYGARKTSGIMVIQ
jgi:subtilisin-like proprotein convertase family protein